MEAQELTKEEQLALAETMMNVSRTRFKRVLAPNTLLWGYLLLAVSLCAFVVTHCLKNSYGYLIWLVMLLGIPFSMIVSRRVAKEHSANSRIDKITSLLWTWVAITACASALVGKYAPVAVAMLLAVGHGTTGSILRIKPEIWTAIPFILIAPAYCYFPISWVGLEFAVLGAIPMIALGHWLQKSK